MFKSKKKKPEINYGFSTLKYALLFVFLPQSKIGHRFTTVKLRGLKEQKNYKFNLFGNYARLRKKV